MAVDNEVIVRRTFVLADTRFEQGCVFHGRKAEGQVIPKQSQSIGVYSAFAERRIELGPAGVIGNLEAAAVNRRHSVDESIAMIRPDGKLRFREAVIG